MVTHPAIWRQVESRLQAKKPRSYAHNRKLFNSLHREARALRVLPSLDRLDGLEVDLRLAAALRRLAQ